MTKATTETVVSNTSLQLLPAMRASFAISTQTKSELGPAQHQLVIIPDITIDSVSMPDLGPNQF